MKIIQVIQKPQLRGAEIFACQLASELQKKGHEVVVVSLFKGNGVLPFSGKFIQMNLSFKKRLFDFNGWRSLARIINDEGPDIIQANAGDTLKYAVLSRMLFAWKGILIFRNASTVSLYIRGKMQKWWMSKLYTRVDYVISVSDYTKNDLLNLFPFLFNKIITVPIGFLAHEAKVIQKDPGQIVLLNIGGFSFEKNHEGLIRIFERLKSRTDNCVLWLVGDGPLKPATEKLVAMKGLQPCVIFWGYQNDPFQFLKSSDVFLLPSVIEGLPGVILEAFYCKVPVVAYNVGAISELVIHQKTGWLIEKNDETKFAEAVVQVIEQKEKVRSVRDKAFEFVCNNYQLDSVADKFISVYAGFQKD
jgi:glycosyltransferase involved in cell wall biosynthesis